MLLITKISWKSFQQFLKFPLNFSQNFLKFFQKLSSAYIFINCTNLSKFVKIVFDTYLNFIKLSIFKVQNVNNFFVKLTQILCIIYTSFLKISQWFLKFPRSFPKCYWNSFSTFQQILDKTNNFSNFRYIFRTVPQSLNDILLSFLKISQIFVSKIYSKSR